MAKLVLAGEAAGWGRGWGGGRGSPTVLVAAARLRGLRNFSLLYSRLSAVSARHAASAVCQSAFAPPHSVGEASASPRCCPPRGRLLSPCKRLLKRLFTSEIVFSLLSSFLCLSSYFLGTRGVLVTEGSLRVGTIKKTFGPLRPYRSVSQNLPFVVLSLCSQVRQTALTMPKLNFWLTISRLTCQTSGFTRSLSTLTNGR